MSTELRERGPMVVLPPSVGPDAKVNPSMTRWVLFPYRDVNNMGPLGLARHFGAAPKHRYVEFQRCTFYPLRDISWSRPDLAAIVEQQAAGLSNSGKNIPDKVHVKYAYEQAEEIASSFGDVGAVVLQPGLFPDGTGWVDDFELVQLIAETIQPKVFALHEMLVEIGVKAKARIAKSEKLDDEGKQLADLIRLKMLEGARLAIKEAQREYEVLIQHMGNAAVGAVPKIATPNDFHVWVCRQLGHPVPSMVAAGGTKAGGTTDDSLKEAVSLLAQKAVRDDVAERQKAADLEARLAALEGGGKRGRKAKEAA